jgi:signal transduction histidine kinase
MTLRDFALSPIDPRSWIAVGAIIVGFFVGLVSIILLATCLSVGGSLMIVLVGFAFVGLGIETCRYTAKIERWRMTLVDPRPLRPHLYRPYGKGLRDLAEAVFMDQNRWRDVIYVLVAFPLTILEFSLDIAVWVLALAFLVMPFVFLSSASIAFGQGSATLKLAFGSAQAVTIPVLVGQAAPLLVALGFVAGVVLLPVAASFSRGLLVLHRAVAEGLLCTSEEAALRERVETLTESRSAMLQVEQNELRRIERDLHDGAQQRLVSLAIDLSLASDRVDTDPAGAKALLLDAREQVRQALAELRDLVRGTAPAILMDRGLVAALGSIAARCPIPTAIVNTIPLGERQPHVVERAAYFVVAEALTNVAKHAAATRCEVRCRQESHSLVVEVSDDGRGGAQATPGGGLAGLRDRVEALDGRLTIDSPAGGPTLLRAELPTW